MGGKGSGGARSNAGRKPKVQHPNWGGRREGQGRPKGSVNKKTEGRRRVPLNVYIDPATKEVIQSIKESEGLSEGIVIDRLATFYNEHKD